MASTKPTSITAAQSDRAAEHWIATEGVARFDAHAAAPENTLAADEAGRRLRRHLAGRSAHKKA
ncbi:MAG TPA: hypothetical protein VII73_13940 [Caulobacteraceae bacterium]